MEGDIIVELLKTNIHWLPAHPAHGSMSMWKYWSLLEAEVDAKDDYYPQSILGAASDVILNRGSKMKRGWTREVTYPLTVRTKVKCGLAHILDHSWSDLVTGLPRSVKSVVTVHDLIPLRYSGELSSKEVERFKSRVSKLRNVDAIIAVSEYTKNEIIEILNISPDRIFVVPNGVSFPSSNEISRKLGNADQLRVGSLGSVLMRKNLKILPPALKAYKASFGREVKLVRAGLPLPDNLKSELITVLGTDGVEEWGRVNELRLEDFYQSIDVMVVPSLYEGFGLPVLEAMARGIPVISSNTTSLPEVGGGAALYFEPEDPESLSDCLRMLEDSELYTKLSTEGLLRSKKFSWRKSLEGVYAVYNEVLGI